MRLCFFEDEKLVNFHPLTLTRPIDDLRLGIFTIREKWQFALKTDSFVRIVRPTLQGVFEPGEEITSEHSCLWINARYLPTDALTEEVQNLDTGTCLQLNSTIIAARTDGSTSQKWVDEGRPDFSSLLVIQSQPFNCLEYPWDLIHKNSQEIIRDFQLTGSSVSDNIRVSPRASLENGENITIKSGAEIEAGAVLDAREGPIYIGKNAIVMAGAILRGPVAVCEGAIIKSGAKIYGGTTAGPVCKVGGEVSTSVFHSYSNKAHQGYLGHSLIGQWCNFGAGTMVSNLKTNYSNVRVSHWETEEKQDSGEQFIGVILGDHSKTAINAVINSGTVAGVCCNILSRDFPPKLIRSFSWVGTNVIQPYRIDKALEAMELMMARRDVDLTEDYKKMMRHFFKESRQKK